MGASDTKPAGIRWARVLATLLALFFLSEAAAQLIIFQFAGKPFRSLSLYDWSPYGLVRNNPELTSPAFIINTNGFRDTRDYEKRKAPGTFRVMLFGGSVLYSGVVPAAARLHKYGRIHSDQTVAPYLAQLLRQDQAFAGADIEVINTAVNFNRIVEVSSAYLADYLHWQPDVVIVFGSINNFGSFDPGAIAAGKSILQVPHPWRAEFERLVNDRSLLSTLERTWRSAAEHSAVLALSSKIITAAVDRLGFWSRSLAPSEPKQPNDTVGSGRLDEMEEAEAYIRLYASYSDAMIAAARRAGQMIAFVWEPHLADLEGVKPMSTEELSILPASRRTPKDRAHQEQQRQLFRRLFTEAGVPVVDPTEPLRHHKETVFVDYGHYTPDGNRFMAQVTYDQLRPALIAQFEQSRLRRERADQR